MKVNIIFFVKESFFTTNYLIKESKIDKLIVKLYQEKHYILLVSDRLKKEQKKLKGSKKTQNWLNFAIKLREYSSLADDELESLRNDIEQKLQIEQSVVKVLEQRLTQELGDILLEFNVDLISLKEKEELEETENFSKKIDDLLEEMSEDEDSEFSLKIFEKINIFILEELEKLNKIKIQRKKLLIKVEDDIKSLEIKEGQRNKNGLDSLHHMEDISEISGKENLTQQRFPTQSNLEESLIKR